MGIDIVIVSFNTRDLLRACLDSIRAHGAGLPNLRTIVVDNGSSDGSPDLVRREYEEVCLVPLDRNLGFGAANNRGMQAGSGDYILFLNSDAELTAGALGTLVDFLERRPQCVAVGPRLEYPDGGFQPSCRRFPTLLRGFWNTTGLHRRLPRAFQTLHSWLTEREHVPGARVDMVSGACFLVRRSYIESIGGFDENLFLYEEELDIFLPARRRGYDVCYCPDARVIHHHGASSGEFQGSDTSLYHLFRSKYYAFRKHYGRAVAALAFASDYAVFLASIAVNRLRGTPTSAGRYAALCRKGYRGSFD